ncbi:hypothetical protein PHISCL_09645 [Aspergillus sclerotialis]|uniref:Uncharacterized protein n=1 Tax=Aspergillus sclerotialis TaxID=2070753 RepID=A0A3A2ZLI2_9EURO|nr:hypothetical protein PHISCL_09645 [Aspergillus sclerotialis]
MKFFNTYLPILALLRASAFVAAGPVDSFGHGQLASIHALDKPFDGSTAIDHGGLHAHVARMPRPKKPKPEDFKYGEIQMNGIKYIDWLRNPDAPRCKIGRSHLTYEQLENEEWDLDVNKVSAPGHTLSKSQELGLPDGKVYTQVEASKEAADGNTNSYITRIGDGVMFAMSNSRYDGHPWSDVAMAVFRQFSQSDLKYVFRYDVVNSVTTSLMKRIYEENGIPVGSEEQKVWKEGTEEYAAIMGCPNAKGVLALLLSNYDRGTKRVPEIVTWYAGSGPALQMFLPIE